MTQNGWHWLEKDFGRLLSHGYRQGRKDAFGGVKYAEVKKAVGLGAYVSFPSEVGDCQMSGELLELGNSALHHNAEVPGSPTIRNQYRFLKLLTD